MTENTDLKKQSSDISIGFPESPKSTSNQLMTIKDKSTKSGSKDSLNVSYGERDLSIADICGVLLYCETHKKIAIMNITSKGFWIPLIVLNSNDSWRVASIALIDLIIESKSELLITTPELINVFRVQLPQKSQFVTRVTFVSNICKDPKSQSKDSQCCKDNKRYKWIPVKDVINNPLEKFWGPEIQHFIRFVTQIDNKYLLMQSIESVKEFDTKDALKYAPRKVPMNIDDDLLKSACFKEKDVLKLYQQFVEHCYPSQFMTFLSFKKFVNKIQWKIEESKFIAIFRAFNYNKNSFLNFYELLLGLAAMDSATEHGGNSGHLRCLYIFRYYDSDSDGKLDHSDVCRLMTDMKSRLKDKNYSLFSNNSIEELASNLIEQIGTNNTISCHELSKAVGTLKLRGTSVLFRSPIATIQQISLNFNYEITSNSNLSSVSLVMNRKYQRSCSVCRQRAYGISANGLKVNQYGEVMALIKLDQKYEQIVFVNDFPNNDLLELATEIIDKITKLSLTFFHNNEDKTEEQLKLIANWFYPSKEELLKKLKIICTKAEELFALEERVIQVCSPCYVFGDIHGNLRDMFEFSRHLFRSSPHLNESSFLFLGDYVDRGRYGVECVIYLFALKIVAPKKFHLLRGNHEVRQLQEQFTFFNECVHHFDQDIWHIFNKAFDRLPIAAILDHTLYCAHGGIPTSSYSIESLQSIATPLPDPETQSVLAWEVLWNDPLSSEDFITLTDFQKTEISKSRGFIVNIKRGTGYCYTTEAVERFLNANQLSHILRGHECVLNGYRFLMKGKVITIFSSSQYCGLDNEAAVLQIDREKIRVIRVQTIC